MKKLVQTLLASSFLLSFAVLPSQALEASPLSYYYGFYQSQEDYLEIQAMLEAGQGSLSSKAPSFHQSQSENLRALAGNRAVVHEILDQIISPGFTDTEKVKAIYDFPMYNFHRDDNPAEVLPAESFRTPYTQELTSYTDLGTYLLYYGVGGCQEFSSLFTRLMNSAGFPCFNVLGNYVMGDGRELFHAFNRAKVNDTWYWYDVDVEGSVYRRGDVSSPIYFLYQKNSAEWSKNHNWIEADLQSMQSTVDNTSYYPTGTIMPYNLNTVVKGNDNTLSVPAYCYVDLHSYALTESVPLLPFYAVMEHFGYNAFYNGDTGHVEVHQGSRKIEFSLSSRTCWVNGVYQPMAVSLETIDDSLYISTDDLMLALDFDVNIGYYQDGTATQQILLQGETSTTLTATPSNTPSYKTATPSTAKVEVNGQLIPFTAYTIDGFNYFKLTDLAYALDDSQYQFQVGWDQDKGVINLLSQQGHVLQGTELAGHPSQAERAEEFSSPVYLDGKEMNVVAYVIDGSSYFQLDTLKEALGFSVTWNGVTSTISIISPPN